MTRPKRTREQNKWYWRGFFAALAMIAFTILFAAAVFAAYTRIFRAEPAPVVETVTETMEQEPVMKPSRESTVTLPSLPPAVSVGTQEDRAACYQITIFNNMHLNQGAQDWRKCVEDQKALLISRINSPQGTPAMTEEIHKIEAQGY